MIHRFVDLPEEPENDPIFLYKLHHEETGGFNRYQRWWLGGNLATPVPIPGTQWSETEGTVRGTTSYARLSRDRTRVLYNWADSSVSPGPGKIKICPAPPSVGSTVDVAAALSATDNIGWACWNGDDTKVVYARDNPSGGVAYAEIRIVDDDGSNDTLLYSRGGTLSGEFLYINLESLLVNHAGTKIVWTDEGQSVGGFTNAGVYMMDIDGSNVTRIVDVSDNGAIDHLYGFSHDDQYLAYSRTFSGQIHFRIVDMSGTSTNLLSSNVYRRGQYDFQWLPDDSGFFAMHQVYLSEPKSVIEVIAADGSGATALSPERRIDTSGAITTPKNYPVVCDADDRIYWYDLASTSVVSVAADGSDFRTDHTLDGTGTDVLNDQEFRTLFSGT